MTKPTSKPRHVVTLPPDASYDEICEFVEQREAQPIEKASRKLYDFVNACVADADFRDPQSTVLLDLLLIVRDELCDNINEHWTLDDVMQPLTAQARRIATQRQTSRMVESRKATAESLEARNRDIFAKVEALKARSIPGAARKVAAQYSLSVSTVDNICTVQRKLQR